MDFILEIDNNLSPEKCEDIIKRFEKDDRRRPGLTTASNVSQIEYKKSTDLCITGLEGWTDIDKYLYEKLKEGISKYQNHLKDKIGRNSSHFEAIVDSGYQVQRTSKGEYYSWHDDSNMKTGRIFTYIWYLNTMDPCSDGGVTIFHDGRQITPEQGKLLIFPATWTYVHAGMPVIGNRNKYICTGWILKPTT